MRFLNPKIDFAFKRIFGSAESGDILISFLNAILNLQSPHRIAAVDILDPYLAPKIKGMERATLAIVRSLLSLMDDKTIADSTGKIQQLRKGEK